MKKLIVLFFSSIVLVSLSCQLTSTSIDNLETETPKPLVDSTNTPAPPTKTLRPTSIPPTKTPLLPTKTPKPTAIPTSEPLVLTDNAFDADIKEACKTDVNINSFENNVFSFGGGNVSMINGRIALWCYGAKHKWIDEIKFAGYTFSSDKDDPMQFEVVKDVGYRFLSGVGVLTYPDGKEEQLYRPTKTAQLSLPTKTTRPPATTASGKSECEFDDGKSSEIRFESPYSENGIVLDGKLSSLNEWSDAFCMDVQFYEWGDMQSGKVKYARWYVKHDEEFIYFLVLVKKELGIKGVAVDYFWPVYTGTWAHSDGVYVNLSGSSQDLANWDESNWYDDIELSPPGSIDVEAAVKEIEDFYWFEIIKPLNSGDAYDWALEPGDLIGSAPSDSFLFAIVTEDSFFSRNLKMKLALP